MEKFAQSVVAIIILFVYLFAMGLLAHIGWWFLSAGWNLLG